MIGQGFRQARLRKGVSVLEAAKALGVTDACIYQWETGISIPRGSRLKEIADYYGVTIEFLLTGGN